MSLNFFDIIDILSTLSFAISGTSAAIKKGLDIFGIVIVSFVTSIGGGTLRDILIGQTPVAWLQNDTTIGVILIGTFATIAFGKWIKRLNYTLFLFDAMGLGLFTLIGIHKGMSVHLSPLICIALGAITGSFGGVIRDVLLNEIPLIFRKEVYASASIAGGTVYYGLQYFFLNDTLAQIICITLIVFLRVLAVRYQLSLPTLSVEKE